jgi:hypothetical protein
MSRVPQRADRVRNIRVSCVKVQNSNSSVRGTFAQEVSCESNLNKMAAPAPAPEDDLHSGSTPSAFFHVPAVQHNMHSELFL